MKVGLQVLASVATLAGFATTHLLMSNAEQGETLPAFREATQPQSASVKLSAILVRTGSLPPEATRPPVPILLAHRSDVASAREAAPARPSPDDNATTPRVATEMAAKSAIEADGYTSVHVVNHGPDGAWQARALRGETEVLLKVKSTGEVSSD